MVEGHLRAGSTPAAGRSSRSPTGRGTPLRTGLVKVRILPRACRGPRTHHTAFGDTARVAQLAEAAVSSTARSRFESGRGHGWRCSCGGFPPRPGDVSRLEGQADGRRLQRSRKPSSRKALRVRSPPLPSDGCRSGLSSRFAKPEPFGVAGSNPAPSVPIASHLASLDQVIHTAT